MEKRWLISIQSEFGMFQNSYQNGDHFQLYDPKIAQDKLKLLFKLTNLQGNNKVFDKDLKTFVLEFASPTAKISFPKDDKKDLYLIQQFLVLQIFFFPGMSWGIELVLSDLTKSKRRIILSPSTNKVEIKPFFIKTPCHGYEEGLWNNLIVDLHSYIDAFKGQTFRSLDAIYLTGHFKLRRIYTVRTEPAEVMGQEGRSINFLPKHFYFPQGLPTVTKLNRYGGQLEDIYEPTEPSTKNSSFFKGSKMKPLTPITPVTPYTEGPHTDKFIESSKKLGKAFLANTNGTEMLNRMRKEEKFIESDNSQGTHSKVETGQSKEKYVKNKKILTQTQQMPAKTRNSVEKDSNRLREEKAKTKAKLNPWRTNHNINEKEALSDISQLHISKHESDSQPTVHIPILKAELNLAEKPTETKHHTYDRRSDYSDSQYVELSQKFSTVTDGKFERQSPMQSPNDPSRNEQQDQIEENIEMESNSMYSNTNKKEAEPIMESLCDSLEKHQKKKSEEELARSSLYGFGERLVRQFMGEVERPYSPPLGDREETQEDVSRNQEKEEVELIYDPVLKCYYDHKTHTYYELKN